MTTAHAPKAAGRTLGEIFTEAKEARKNSHQAVANYILLHQGQTVTGTTIGNYHNDSVATHDPVLVAGIAEFYGLTLDQLPPAIQEQCYRAYRALAGRGPHLVGRPDDGDDGGGAAGAPPGTRTPNLRGKSPLHDVVDELLAA